MPTLSTSELTKLSHTLGRALAAAAVNQLGRDTGQAERLRTVTPHRLFLAMVSTLGSGRRSNAATSSAFGAASRKSSTLALPSLAE